MRVFLSYHAPDARKAEALKAAIEAKEPETVVFVAHQSQRHGAPWQPQLAGALEEADAFIILVGKSIGQWQLPEYYAAHDRSVKEPSFPLLPILTAEQGPSLPFLGTIHWLQTPDPASEPSLSTIIAALKGTATGASKELWRGLNPYRGLESLKEQDADLFFGREAETKAVLDRLLQAETGDDCAVTLVGNSGVGKSSIVEAGVFAALHRQRMPDGSAWPASLDGSREWAYLTMRPGEDPFASLVSSFMGLWFGDDATNPDLYERRARWIERLKNGRAIKDLLDATQARFEAELGLAAPRRIVLNVNQSEELYSLTPDALRDPFSRLLAEGLSDPRLRVLASLRSDYYGHLQANKPLFKRSMRLDVLPFDAEGLKTAITGPARALGARFEPEALADFIVSSAAGQSGALPMLAFYMMDLWRRMQARGDGMLKLADKSEIVDVASALTAEADRFLAAHPADLDAIRRLFTLKLALVQEQGKPVRRRVLHARLDGKEARLIDALADARLVTTGEDAGGGFAEVAHEVLLHNWRTLASWLDAERDFLVFKGQCEGARRKWDGAKRDPRALLSGLDLIQAEQWLATRARDFDPEDADFIIASIDARNAELKAAARLRRFVQAGTAIVAAALAILSAFAIWQRNIAEERSRQAENEVAVLGILYNQFAKSGDAARTREELDREMYASLERAAARGNPAAARVLGVIAGDGRGGTEDYVRAREWLEKAAAMGDAAAMGGIGIMYRTGRGAPKDYGKAREWFEKAAAKGDTPAMEQIAVLYEHGEGVAPDYAKAREWLEKAAVNNNASAMGKIGDLYREGHGVSQDYAKAREWYEKAAAKGNDFAMFDLGLLYQQGLGVRQDYVKAREWYEKAVDKGDDAAGLALASLGFLYQNGQGVLQDHARARQMFEKGASRGNAIAMWGIAELYSHGTGVPQNYILAREWYEKAAAKDFDWAVDALANLWEQGQGGPQDYTKARELYEKSAGAGYNWSMKHLGALYENGRGVPQDYAKAREWYEKAAAKDNAVAMNNLGALFENGRGVPQDYAKAREWYEKAAAEGWSEAMKNLGWLYANGQGVPQDYVKALDWYEKAAAKENDWAMYNLGVLYENGRGMPQDYAKAREWYERAAAKDNDWAMNQLGLLYDNARGLPQDYAHAREWYEKAAAKGNRWAMNNLGVLYEHARGVAQDYVKAREWYEKAAAEENDWAMYNLGLLYANGQGADQDYAKASEWFGKAAAKDNAQAMHSLGWLYGNGRGVLQDYTKAREWFGKAAGKGIPNSMVALSWLYAESQGGAQDFVLSVQWARKAALASTADASVKASALVRLSFSSLFIRDFAGALSASEEAISLLPNNLTPVTNKAHALMFLERAKEAQELYLRYKGQRLTEGAGLWEEEILKDFDKLEKAGVTHPQMAEIRKMLAPEPKKK